MGPKTKDLVTILKELTALLSTANEKHWSQQITKAKSRIQRSDFSGIQLLLSFYGGMGSFSDLMIHPVNGHSISENDSSKFNERLDKYRSDIYRLSKEIRNNADIK